MDDLRKYFLNNDVSELEKIVQDPKSDQKKLYQEIEDLYSDCEIGNIPLSRDVYNFVVKFIVNHRLSLGNLKEDPSTENTSDIQGRMNLLVEILEEYSDFKFHNDDEKFHFMKFIAKNLNVIMYSKDKFETIPLQKLPWSEIKFMICIFIAINTDRRQDKYAFVDYYFPFLVDEKLILDTLKRLLKILKRENDFQKDEWSHFLGVYRTTRHYYLLKKIWNHLNDQQNMEWNEFKENTKILPRFLQMIGECFLQLSDLGDSESIDDESEEREEREVKEAFKEMRHNLSHYIPDQGHISEITEQLFFNIRLDMFKLHIIISEKILYERHKIGKSIIKELKTISNIDDLQKRIHSFPSPGIRTEYFAKQDWFMNYFNKLIDEATKKIKLKSNNRTDKILEKSDKLKKLVENLKHTLNLNLTDIWIFFYIEWFKKKQNPTLNDVKCKFTAVRKFSKYFSLFCNNLGKFICLLSEIPEQVPLYEIFEKFRYNNEITKLKSNVVIDESLVIADHLRLIESVIEDDQEKTSFRKIVKELELKRQLCREFKKNNKFETISQQWPNRKGTKLTYRHIQTYKDPLKVLLKMINENNPQHLTIKQFLFDINFSNENIVEIIKEKEHKRLNDDLQKKLSSITNLDDKFLIEMHFLECIEIMRRLGIEISKDYNFLDFDCTFPIGRNLRNFICHGDIYLELFISNEIPIVQAHLENISENYKTIANFGFSRKDDFVLIKNKFYKQRSSIRESYELFKYKFKSIEDINNITSQELSFKVRDCKDRTIVHYLLSDIDDNNLFFTYLVEKLTKPQNCSINHLFERILKDSKSIDYKNHFYILIQQKESIDSFIDDFINTNDILTQRFILCHILCFNCKKLDFFSKLIMDNPTFKSNNGLLHTACAQNQQIIVEFLLKRQFYKNNINAKYFNLTPLCYAIENNHTNIVSLLLDNGASVLEEDKSLFAYNGKMTGPLITVAQHGKMDIIRNVLLNVHSEDIDNIFKFLMAYIPCNENCLIVKHLIDKYPELTLVKFILESLLMTACWYARMEIVITLVENVDDWSIYQSHKILGAACMRLPNPKFIQYLIDKGLSVNCDSDELSPIMSACSDKSLKVIKVLIENGADIAKKLSNGKSALHYAIASSSNVIRKIQILTKNGESIFEKELFSVIAICSNVDMFNFILSMNPDPSWCLNILPFIVEYSHFKILEILLKHISPERVNFNIECLKNVIKTDKLENLKLLFEYSGFISNESDLAEVLRLGVERNHIEVARIAINKGANVNYKYPLYGNLTLLQTNEFADDFSSVKMAKYLIAQGANVNVRNDANVYLLDSLFDKNAGKVTELMRLLSENGAISMFGINFFHFLPHDRLLFGVLTNNLGHVEDALRIGANVNHRYENFRNGTILHICSDYCFDPDLSIIELLLEKGVEFIAVDNDHCTALELAYFKVNIKVFNFLFTKVGLNHFDIKFHQAKKPRVLIRGILTNDLKLIDYILNIETNINLVSPNENKFTPLHIACIKSTTKTIQFLLDNGANLFAKDYYNRNALESAAFYNRDDVVKYLLSYLPRISGNDLANLMKIAFYNRHVKIVDVLIKYGADINYAYKELMNLTPLGYACSISDDRGLELAKLLLDCGVKLDIDFGPLSLATRNRNHKVAKLLWERNVTKDEMFGLEYK